MEDLQKHPCCKDNCVVRKLGLSAPTHGYCSSCFVGGFCGPTVSCKPDISVPQQQVEFLSLVEANRSALDEFRVLQNDTKAVKKDKKRNCQAALMQYFRTNGKQIGSNWDWEEAYYVRDASAKKIMVCKEAWCAIVGATVGGVEYIQKLIRSGQASNASLDDNHERIDIAKAFLHWGINVNTYHYYIGAFCVLSAIPQTRASLVAAAWLTDYFDLVGEAQPDVMAIHYDPITIMEIYEEYRKDPFVHDIINGEENILSYSAFAALIRNAFPRVSPREYKSVTGK